MEKVLEIGMLIWGNIHLVSGVLLALIPIFMLVPGEQPEKAMQKIVDFIKKFSKK